MIVHRAYGLRLDSCVDFPNLPTSRSNTADITIRFGSVENLPRHKRAAASEPDSLITKDGISLFWQHIGSLLIKNGSEIVIEPVPGMNEGSLRLALLGQGMALLLYQRGHFVMHASAVAINGSASAFIGEPGQGKSTVALAFCLLGHHLLADDITALVLNGHVPLVIPAFPQLNVSPETLSALSCNPQQFDKLEPWAEKRAYPATVHFHRTPVPLRRIYVLEEGTHTTIQPLSQLEAFLQLDRHSYNPTQLEREGTSDRRHFHQCAALVKTIPVCRATVNRSLEYVAELVELIERDIADLGVNARS